LKTKNARPAAMYLDRSAQLPGFVPVLACGARMKAGPKRPNRGGKTLKDTLKVKSGLETEPKSESSSTDL
jgi:hypothetical protein